LSLDFFWKFNIYSRLYECYLSWKGSRSINVRTHIYLGKVCCNLYQLRIECILLKFHWGMKALTEVHFQWSATCWKCSSINAFIPQWNFKRMHSILIIIFKSPKFNIVEFFVVNFICVRLFAVGNYYAIDCLHLMSSWRHVQVRIWVSLGCETSLL
jgi:hypothetical protein